MKVFSNNPLASPFSLREQSPRILISLWDMNQIVAKEFIFAWNCLQEVLQLAGEKRGQKATEVERGALVKLLIEVHHKSHQLGIRQAVRLSKRLMDQMQDPGCHRIWIKTETEISYKFPKEIPLPDFETIYWQALSISTELYEGLQAVRLAVILADKAKFFECEHLFGKEVQQAASPELNAEIRAAGTCLALSLNTAAVFHLMRVAEFGLRILARRVRVKLKHPLEFADWGTVIDECDKNLKNLKLTSRGKKKAAQLEFYSNAISECRAFKETWRDCVMHARRLAFTEKEVLVVYERVGDFWKRLAKKIPLK